VHGLGNCGGDIVAEEAYVSTGNFSTDTLVRCQNVTRMLARVSTGDVGDE